MPVSPLRVDALDDRLALAVSGEGKALARQLLRGVDRVQGA